MRRATLLRAPIQPSARSRRPQWSRLVEPFPPPHESPTLSVSESRPSPRPISKHRSLHLPKPSLSQSVVCPDAPPRAARAPARSAGNRVARRGMQVRQLILTASAFVIAIAGPAHPQGSGPVAGDSGLQSLVAEALARNPTVAQRQAAVRAATLRVRPAGSLPDPMLTVGVMDLVLPHFEFNQSDFTEADVELSQEIPWPGSLGARSGVMRAAAAGARAEEGTVRREVTTTMAVAYYRLGYAVTALETLRHQRELLDAAVQLSTTRYATGAAPQSDPLQAKLARDRLRSEEFALESERVAALAGVNALRNRAPGDSVPVSSIDLAALRAGAATQPPADSLVALALATHPRLAARRAAVDAATRTIQVERLGARPDFTLSARYGYRPVSFGFDFPDFFSAFVGVRLPIWAWRKQNRLADAARADSTGAEIGRAHV